MNYTGTKDGAAKGKRAGLEAMQNTLKYLFGGLFLFIPEHHKFMKPVYELFKDAWPITAALMWISATIVCPLLIKEFTELKSLVVTFVGLGIIGLFYAMWKQAWNAGGIQRPSNYKKM